MPERYACAVAKRKRRGGTATLAPPSDPPIQPGVQSLRRSVPPSIDLPPYAKSGEPGPSLSPLVRTDDEIARMRRTGTKAAEILMIVGGHVAPGVTTDELDRITHEEALKRNCYPSPLNYRGFPKSVCTSINEVICHGIPDSRPLAEGDIINIDVTVFCEGVHGDTSTTFIAGETDDFSETLVVETRHALYAGMDVLRPGSPVNAIGRAIESHAKSHNLGVVREFIGHGVGTDFHGGLQIPHYYDRRASSRIDLGMSFTIEPMLTLGAPDMYMWDDDWTALTLDGRRTAQFEHTMVMGEDGVDIMTVTPAGECAHDMYR